MAEKQPKRERHDSTIDNLLLCPICQGQINGASLTTCGHRFCSRCIRQWLRNKTNCPTCRRDIRASNLVEDTNFDILVEELLNKKKMEQQQQQQQQASGQAEVAIELYREVQKQNHVIVNLKDNLLEEKNKEMRRLEAAKEELTTTNERLKRENDGLKSQINDELPGLRETQRELQGKVDRKRAKKQLLKMQITDLENRLTSTKTMCQTSETQKKTLKQSYDQKVVELQNAKKLLDGSREENKVLQIEIRSCKESSTLLQSDQEKIVKEKAQLLELIGQMFFQKQENDNQLAYFRENTILTQEHEKILNSKLESKENELRDFYDNEYGSKVRRTESMNETLQNRVETLENDLKSRDEVGDELKKATRSFKSLVKEKEDFRDEINKKDKEIERLQHELARSKARTYELEKKISLSNERVKNVRAGKEDKLIK